MVFGRQPLQRDESNRRHADGVRVENIPRNHDVRPPREDLKSNERPTVVNLSTSQTGSSSCQCTTTLNGGQKETKKYVNTMHRQLRVMLVNSLEIIGLSWGLDQKRNGTELTLTNPTDHGIKLHRI